MPGYKNVLVATDLSEHAVAIAHKAAELASGWNARMTLLHVIDHFPEDEPVDRVPREDQDPQEYLLADINRQLVQLRDGLGGDGIEIQAVTTTQSISRGIAEATKSEAADLVIVGTSAQHRFMGSPGSVAHALISHLACDLLVLHPD